MLESLKAQIKKLDLEFLKDIRALLDNEIRDRVKPYKNR